MDRQLEIAWGGEAVKITPNMELAHEIESIISVPSYIMTMEHNFKMYETVKIIHAVLAHAGIKVTQDDVYNELSGVPFAEIVPLMIEILQKVFPMFFNDGAKKTAKKRRSARKK